MQNTDKPTTTASAPETRKMKLTPDEKAYAKFYGAIEANKRTIAPETRTELPAAENAKAWRNVPVSERRYLIEQQRTIPAEKPTAQFGMSVDGRPTLIIGDHRSTDEKLRCAQVQMESDRHTIANMQTHADKLAEALRDLLADSRSLEIRHYAQEMLSAYESEVR